MRQLGAYIYRVEPSHLSWGAVFRILTDTKPMTIANTMMSTLLVAQLRRFHLLALARLWGVASCAPWGNGVKKTTWRSHLTLPVSRPEEVEARQCEEWVVTIGRDSSKAKATVSV